MRTSRTPNAEAGFTLLELLVVLTVLALASSLLVHRYAGAGNDFARGVAAVRERLETARAEAMRRGRPRRVTAEELAAAAPGLRIGGAPEAAVTFLPDGTSSGGAFLLVSEARSARLEIDWLTGRTMSGEP